MKKTQLFYKCIAALLLAALLIGVIGLCGNLPHKLPQSLNTSMQELNPEADLPVPGISETAQTEPPTTEPQETEPPTTEPQETEPPETEPPATEPQEIQHPATEPQDTLPSTAKPEGGEAAEPVPGEEITEDSGGQISPSEGPEDDSELKFVTSLLREYTYNQLENDVVHFTAYLVNGGDFTLRVKLRNSKTPQNGQYLTGDGDNYQAILCRNEANFFTFYAKDGGTTVEEITIPVRYVAQMADESHPEVGEHPPSIVTNLDGVTQLSNRNFTLTVLATDYTGKALYSSNIEVRLDGQQITLPTGGPLYEYQCYFQNPDEGDIVPHTVTVRAWDNEGNSSFAVYNFDYHFVDTGDEIGTAYIILDATVVGLGVMEEPFTYRIKQNVPASYAILEMLDEYGYEYDYGGTPDEGFYLRRISRGGMTTYTEIPDNLWKKVLQDGLTLTNQYDFDSLGEFDYTQGSGWMYSIGGEVYAGKGLSNYFLNNGETLYLRFTLAYGKDIGGYNAAGGSFGILPTYCGKWINDTYIDQHQWGGQAVIKEPTCTESGEMSTICTVCGDAKDTAEIPALGHSFQEVSRVEPADGNDGYIIYQCERCQEQLEEIIPWKEEEALPPGETEP